MAIHTKWYDGILDEPSCREEKLVFVAAAALSRRPLDKCPYTQSDRIRDNCYTISCSRALATKDNKTSFIVRIAHLSRLLFGISRLIFPINHALYSTLWPAHRITFGNYQTQLLIHKTARTSTLPSTHSKKCPALANENKSPLGNVCCGLILQPPGRTVSFLSDCVSLPLKLSIYTLCFKKNCTLFIFAITLLILGRFG